MQVSVIIVKYNTKKRTAEYIDSVFENSKNNVEFEAILIDNVSTL